MKEFTNRQMAAAFRRIGFRKSNLQLARNGFSYEHPDGKALFTFGKGEGMNVTCSAPGEDRLWSFPLGITEEKFLEFQDADIPFPWCLKDQRVGQHITNREVLLCVARAYGSMCERRAEQNIKPQAAEPDPDSIMGIMNNIKSLSDEIKGGA